MNWEEFYKKRINSSYQKYFEKKYLPFLEFILKQEENIIFEAGCGIGSISKFLIKENKKCFGIDLDKKMVNLANHNVGKNIFYQDNLITNKQGISNDTLSITHGVLEHFSDEKIIKSLKSLPNSIHYVPLDKYKIPSFGDERLLSKEYWIELTKTKEWFTFNNGYDLCFKIENNGDT